MLSYLQPWFLKMRLCFCMFWPVHPHDNSLRIPEGIQTFTLLGIFLLCYDKVFTEMNNIIYTRSLNILS